MKIRRILNISSGFLLIAAASFAMLASRPPDAGIRLPVHGADGRLGYIDENGWMVITPVWKTATPFGPDDHAVVSMVDEPGGIRALYQRWIQRRVSFPRTSYYRIDRQGHRTAIPAPLFDPLGPGTTAAAPGEMTMTQRGTEFLWIQPDGSPAFPGAWQQTLDFKGEDPAAVFENGCWEFINRKGEKIASSRWDRTQGFNGNGRAPVAIGLKWGAIDREGDLVIPLRFKSLGGFDAAGLCAAEMESGWGFINPEGKIAVPFRYAKTEPFDRFGMARVQLPVNHEDCLSGWIDRHGKPLIEARYDLQPPVWAENFKEHELLPVSESGKAGLIDRKGQSVITSANGELATTGDPAAPDRYWITTLPYRSAQAPDGKARSPFRPSCHDSSGNLIWNGSTVTPRQIHGVAAAAAGILAAFLFVAGRRKSASPVGA